MKRYLRSLLIFRRDLRLQDNTALISACRQSEKVTLGFIFDPRQLTNNPYRSEFAVRFMVESLKDLAEEIEHSGAHLNLFYGEAHRIVETLIQHAKIDAVFVNRDYTPFSQSRDFAIEDVCRKAGVIFESQDDALLHPPETIKKADGGIYTVFTPYFKKCREYEVRSPEGFDFTNIDSEKLPGHDEQLLSTIPPDVTGTPYVAGGRGEGLKRIRNLKKLRDYDLRRDKPADEGGTSGLSAHLKFGTVSAREVYAAVCRYLGESHDLIRELSWRDFFTTIGYHHPSVLGEAFQEKYSRITWPGRDEDFDRWCRAETGFPIVDAGMRQLNETGYMHNRVRMITASFLVKDLHVDWCRGERYFASRLVDYDPFVNNGNWQWAASTGCDAQPYFRIFNPWRQALKFDPECVYIKRWIPELKTLTSRQIHQMDRYPKEASACGYPPVMVDHSQRAQTIKEIFKKCR